MQDDRVTLIPDDGRTFLAHADVAYDIISLEVGQVFRPGVAAFYTTEFYERAAERLRDGGIFSQFMPLTFFAVDDLRSAVQTFLATFPTAFLWYNSSELLLLGVKGDNYLLDRNRFALVATDDRLREDLSYSHWGGPQHWLNQPTMLLAAFLCGPRELATLAQTAPLHRDDLPVLAYATSSILPTHRPETESVPLLRRHLTPVASVLNAKLSASEAEAIERMRERNLRDLIATAHLRSVEGLKHQVGPRRTVEILEMVLEWNPDNRAAHGMMGDILSQAGQMARAEQHYRQAIQSCADDAMARRGLAFVLLRTSRPQEAVQQLELILRQLPHDSVAHNFIGSALVQLGRLPEAIEHFQEAVRLQPEFRDAQHNLEWARGELQRHQGR
jgi:tetratricopeptide (TPR) repeat protein